MSDMLTEPIEKEASFQMTPEIKAIALEEFHKEACAKGYTCSLEEAERAIEKRAEETRNLGFMDTQRAANRMLRRSDTGIGKYISSDDAMKSKAIGGGKGLLLGAPIGLLLGHIAGKRFGIPGAAGLGGALGGGIGANIGVDLAANRYLSDKGLKLTNMGFTSEVSEPAAKKYLDQ